VIRTTRKLLRRGGRERFVWLVNLLLLLSMTLCIASGILISEVALPELGITPAAGSFWRQMHDTTATLTLILVPIHAALDWRWVVGVARRFAAWRPGRSR
jgi:quinol-cytochrome oxidoreductase complex cytochrome b subunit